MVPGLEHCFPYNRRVRTHHAEDRHAGHKPDDMTKGKNAEGKLSLFDACGMAIGGMVGGGIFAVLGEGVARAGNAAWIAFGLAGALALVTGMSYSRLTVSFDEPGGSFTFIEEIAGAKMAGTVSWFLILGYVFTLSLYAYTFGAYSAQLFGIPHAGGILGTLILVALAGLNLLGVRESGVAEDVLVYGKVAILMVVCAAGFGAVTREEALPVFEMPVGGVIGAAALLFVAYEGFQLLTYDYDDLEDHRRNLPRAVWISIPAVTLLYMLIAFVTTGALGGRMIQEHGETILAFVAEPVLGDVGRVAVLVAAVLSTASAINATLFATARLALRVGDDRQIPRFLIRRKHGGVPVVFVAAATLLAILIQYLGRLHEITSFSSFVFLLVFAVVNGAALIHREFEGWKLLLPLAGSLGCVSAAVILAVSQYQESPTLTWGLVATAVALLALRWVDVKLRET